MRAPVLSLVCALVVAPLCAQAQWRTSVLPVLGSAPETGGQFGVAVFRTRQAQDSLGTRPSSLIGNAIVTAKGQRRAFLEYDRWSTGNARRLQVLGVASEFPLPFYGFGDNTPDTPMAYEPRTFELSITRSRKRGEATWRYAGLRVVDTRVIFIDSTANVPFLDYTLLLASLGVIRDSRDNVFAPTQGRVFDVTISAGPNWRGVSNGDQSTLARLRVDWRRYRSLPNGGVLAGQVVINESTEEFPLDQVALVGHHSLNRGYAMGRFRGRGMLASQLEYRSATRLWNDRLGAAAFAGVAFLSGEGSTGRPLPSGGIGLRFRLDPRTRSTIRIDYAKGASGQSGLYVAFNEAF